MKSQVSFVEGALLAAAAKQAPINNGRSATDTPDQSFAAVEAEGRAASTLIVVTVINVVLFVGIFSRMIPFQALMSQVPALTQRGSFNAINASVSQLAGGLAALVAGHIVNQGADGRIHQYDVAGYVVVASSLVACALLWRIQRGIAEKGV